MADMILKMGWTYFLEEPCGKLIYELIDKKIIKCEDVFDVPVLDRIQSWFKQVVILWLKRVLQQDIVEENSPFESFNIKDTAERIF